MPKDLFKYCGVTGNALFLNHQLYTTTFSAQKFKVENIGFYTTILNSLLTVFSRLSGGV